MTTGPTPRAQFNWLTQSAATARDDALARVVSLVDSLKDRGEADRILALARDRLRALRPPRPLGFTRLLFLPLDGAIVPSPRWRRGDPQIPRGCLNAVSAVVHAALGEEGAAIAELCAGRTNVQADHVALVGGRLWPQAAAALPVEAPADFAATGLAPGDYAPIRDLCVPLWRNGSAILAAVHAAAEGPPDPLVRAALGPLVETGPRPFAAALTTILLGATAPGRVCATAAALDPRARAVALEVIDAVLDEPVPALDTLDLRAATDAAMQLTLRLNDLADCAIAGPDRQRKVTAQRRAADEACRERCLAAAEQGVLAPIVSLLGQDAVADADVDAIEAGARGLRALAAVGRRLGDPAAYDRATRATTEAIARLSARAARPGGLTPMDLARTVEILAGPDVAAALLPR